MSSKTEAIMIALDGTEWREAVTDWAHEVWVRDVLSDRRREFKRIGKRDGTRVFAELLPFATEYKREFGTKEGVASFHRWVKTVDGLTLRECVGKFERIQRADRGSDKCSPVLREMNALTPAQLSAVRTEWSRQLREKVKAAEEEDRQREARQCGWDPMGADEP